MTTIRTRKHLFKFYGTLLCLLVLCLGLGTLYLIAFISIFNRGHVHPVSYLLMAASIGTYALGAYALPTYIRAAPTIAVDLMKITINKESVFWDDIENIVFTGKKLHKMLWTWQRMEGMTLFYKNGSAIHLYDDYYHNLWQINDLLVSTYKGIKFQNQFRYRTFNWKMSILKNSRIASSLHFTGCSHCFSVFSS